jgi:putative phosphoribosyl transferase
VIFDDRADAGARLAEALREFEGSGAVVLGIPRGGVLVAAEVARSLMLPLDVVVPRKIGAPRNPELGIGAIAPGVQVLDRRMIERLGVEDAYVSREIAAQEREIERRSAIYRAGRPPVDVTGGAALVVDDGIATGGTAAAALRWARAQDAREVVLAVPVAPPAAIRRLAADADRVVVLETPEPFVAVGEWYRRFGQASDEDVVRALGAARAPS